MTDSSNTNNHKIICQNKKARYEYSIEQIFEAGLVLLGSEVKSLRLNKASIQEGYISVNGNNLDLINSTITQYNKSYQSYTHSETRPRRLLLHKKEINKINGFITKKGYTAIPLSLYFNTKGLVKLEFAIAKGKKIHDKRASLKEKAIISDQKRFLKSHINKI